VHARPRARACNPATLEHLQPLKYAGPEACSRSGPQLHAACSWASCPLVPVVAPRAAPTRPKSRPTTSPGSAPAVTPKPARRIVPLGAVLLRRTGHNSTDLESPSLSRFIRGGAAQQDSSPGPSPRGRSRSSGRLSPHRRPFQHGRIRPLERYGRHERSTTQERSSQRKRSMEHPRSRLGPRSRGASRRMNRPTHRVAHKRVAERTARLRRNRADRADGGALGTEAFGRFRQRRANPDRGFLQANACLCGA
jgi:hypothetical protein